MASPLIELPPELAKRWATARARAAMVGALALIYHDLDDTLIFALTRWGLIREFDDLDDFEIHLGRIEGKP